MDRSILKFQMNIEVYFDYICKIYGRKMLTVVIFRPLVIVEEENSGWNEPRIRKEVDMCQFWGHLSFN